MYPKLLQIGEFSLNSYGFLIAIGFLVSMFFIAKESPKIGIKSETMLDLTFWVFIVGMLGGRILWIITQWSDYSKHPLRMFSIWEGGFVFYGGFISGIVFIYWFSKKKEINMWDAFDLMSPTAAITHSFGRVGCFLAGCCYGTPTSVPWGVRFHGGLVPSHLHGIKLHPTQLYSSLTVALIAILLIWKLRRRLYSGQIMVWYMGIYAVARYLLELVRGDAEREFLIDPYLSTSQGIGAAMLIVAYLIRNYRLKVTRRIQDHNP